MKKFLCVAMFLSISFGVRVFAALPEDIALYFNFNEGGGNKVKDLSKYGNNGEITGKPVVRHEAQDAMLVNTAIV